MLTDRLESLEKLLKETREENSNNISELKKELAAERAAREEKEKEVDALTVRLSQADAKFLHQNEEMCKIREVIVTTTAVQNETRVSNKEKENEVAALTARLSKAEESLARQKEETSKLWEASRALCQSTTGIVAQDEARVSNKEMESLVSTLVAQSAQAVKTLEQQKEETKKVWQAIFVTSKQQYNAVRPTNADEKIIHAHANTTVLELSTANVGPISDLGLLHLPFLAFLKSLRISFGFNVTAPALRHLYSMTWLEELKLKSSNFNDSMLLGISNLTALRRLELIDAQ
ncbi:unnamed protein product, partial [Closterium sp. NIES-54]